MSSNVSRKRSASNRPDEEGNECGNLAKKIKNIHLSRQITDQGQSSSIVQSSNDDSVSSSEQLNEVYPLGTGRDTQKVLTDQVINYSNQILGNNYTPSLGPDQNSEYFETNRILFEANKMRLLRAQMRLLESSK